MSNPLPVDRVRKFCEQYKDNQGIVKGFLDAWYRDGGKASELHGEPTSSMSDIFEQMFGMKKK